MEVVTVGIPRGLLYYRYETLWKTFFTRLGVRILISEPTTLRTAERGMAVAVDEACLSLKLYLGHVQTLLGACDYIFIPRICNFGRNRDLCPRFHALYDITRNTFADSGQKFLTYNIDVMNREEERKAFIALGQSLNFSARSAIEAYKEAKKEEQRVWKEQLKEQKRLLEQKKLKILIAGHDYLLRDAYIGKPITDFLKRNYTVPIAGGVCDRDAALKRSTELSPTCRWEMSREIIGSIMLYKDRIDGIIFLSAFPCGPDAMVNELLLRRLKGMPMLNLVMDGQTGVAGTETRLESFLDILRFKRGML